MTKLKTHYSVFRSMKQPGCVVTTTLCGVYSDSNADLNVEDEKNAVNCKLCLRIKSQPNHWRNKNILTKENLSHRI
jgi:hypothetical protein